MLLFLYKNLNALGKKDFSLLGYRGRRCSSVFSPLGGRQMLHIGPPFRNVTEFIKHTQNDEIANCLSGAPKHLNWRSRDERRESEEQK